MTADVAKADVIITNPTHLAVALRYRVGEMAAPRVLGKGAGFIAEKIREIARAKGIPIVENKPLARCCIAKWKWAGKFPKRFIAPWRKSWPMSIGCAIAVRNCRTDLPRRGS